MKAPKTVTLDIAQRLALETLIQRRDTAAAQIGDVLALVGVTPEQVESLNLTTGEVSLKAELDKIA
jgi:hypothetical protein